ncbi:hypothetical protein [Vibrio crassostreae]|uniref:hypothetical protein n=1 Tax=Vibrio crassostreae TaxID=246167 RepID=UPI001B3169C3|nr:hypothetical protein [Vibrio crassostreae]
MYFLRDPLTQYCIEGAFELGELSPLAFTVGAYLPEQFHRGISLFDISADSTFPDFNHIEETFLDVVRDADKDMLAYLRKPLISVIGSYVDCTSRNLASALVNKGMDCIPEYKTDEGHFGIRVALGVNYDPRLEHINHPLDSVHPTNVARYIQPHLVKHQEMFELSKRIMDLPENEKAANKFERNLEKMTTCQIVSSRVPKEKKPKRKAQRIKKAVARASRLFSMLPTGKKTLSAFLSGEATIVNGSVFNYKITKNYSIHEDVVKFAHIPYRLEVVDKESGLILTELCVVFRGQPMLDQVFSFLMYIQGGEETERELLHTANALNTAEGAYLNEDFVRHFGKKHRAVIDPKSRQLNLKREKFNVVRKPMELVNRELISNAIFTAFNSNVLQASQKLLDGQFTSERGRINLKQQSAVIELAGGAKFHAALQASHRAMLTLKESTK